MILPWAHRLISAGAHGLRRIPGQSVNLAHLLFGAHHAPRPLCLRATRCTPGGFPRGAMGASPLSPLGGEGRALVHSERFAVGCASAKTYFVSTREDAIPFCFKKA